MATKEITNNAIKLQNNLQDQFGGLDEAGKAQVTSSLNDLNTAATAKGLSNIQIPASTVGKKSGASLPTDLGEDTSGQVATGLLDGIDFGNSETASAFDPVENRILELQGDIAGASGFQAEQSREQDIAGLTTNVSDLQGEFDILKAQSQALPDQIEARFGGAGTRRVSGNIQTGKANEIRANAILKAAEVNAASGKLNTAINLVNSAVQAKYAPIYAELALREAQLEVVEKRVGRADAKRVERNKLQLEQNKLDIQKQETLEKGVNDIAMEAISRGATNGEDILKAESVSEAVRLAGDFLEDKSIKLNEALLRERISESKQNQFIKFQQFEDDQAQMKFDNLKERAALGDKEAIKELGIDMTGTPVTVLGTEEKAKLNKELAASDTFKAMQKSQTSWRALKAYEAKFDEVGVTSSVFTPIDAGEMSAIYMTALLNLKEYYNLGVLNGPDLEVMEDMIPQPKTGVVGSVAQTIPVAGQIGALIDTKVKSNVTRTSIQNQKEQFEDKLDDDYLLIRNQYGQYGNAQITGLDTVDQQYIQMKREMSPEVDRMIKENPDMSPSELIQIINTNI